LIKRMINSEDINVTKCEQFWDYLYIDDISRALFKISPYKGLGVTNLSSNNPIQIKDLVEILLLKTNSDSKVNYGAVPYRDDQVMFMCGDNTKLKKSLNWEPLISHEEGLNKTILNIKK
jgi:UDP-glucose 4-epimerase